VAQGTRRFFTCTDSGADARSTVDALTFRAVTRTLLFDHTWQSSTKAMLLVSSDASAKSPRSAPGTVTSMFAVDPAVTQALAMAVRQQFGHLSAGAARGLALRHDHGSNFMAEHVQKQARFWGISPSYAFVAEPETNGVIERFFRTLKEQAIDGRVFQTIDHVRDAVRAFAAHYNAEWLIEKNGYLSPLDARAARLDTTFRRAA
jgi:hypothetical protein